MMRAAIGVGSPSRSCVGMYEVFELNYTIITGCSRTARARIQVLVVGVLLCDYTVNISRMCRGVSITIRLVSSILSDWISTVTFQACCSRYDTPEKELYSTVMFL